MTTRTKSVKEWFEYVLNKINPFYNQNVTYFNPGTSVFTLDRTGLPSGVTIANNPVAIVTTNGKEITVEIDVTIAFAKVSINGNFDIGNMTTAYLPMQGNTIGAQWILGNATCFETSGGGYPRKPALEARLNYGSGILRLTFSVGNDTSGQTIDGTYPCQCVFKYLIRE